MVSEPWDQAARRLVETWLAALGPLGHATTVPGTEGSDPLLYFRQFADVLGQAGDASSGGATATANLHAAAVRMMDALAAQVASLREGLAHSPAMGWTSAFSDTWPPMLGPWREVQAKGARTLRAMNAATEAGRSLQHMHLEVLARALDTCRRRLTESDGPDLDSVRAFFDAWVAIVDAAYRERAFADDYAAAFAEVVNAASELRLAMLEVQSPWSGVQGNAAAAAGTARRETAQRAWPQSKPGPKAAPAAEAARPDDTRAPRTDPPPASERVPTPGRARTDAPPASERVSAPGRSSTRARKTDPHKTMAEAPTPVVTARARPLEATAPKATRARPEPVSPVAKSQARPSKATGSRGNQRKATPGAVATGQEFDITRILTGKS